MLSTLTIVWCYNVISILKWDKDWWGMKLNCEITISTFSILCWALEVKNKTADFIGYPFHQSLNGNIASCRHSDIKKWHDKTKGLCLSADNEVKSSANFRQASIALLEKHKDQMHSQVWATNYALRRRMHEIEKAINELEYQKDSVSAFCFNCNFVYIIMYIVPCTCIYPVTAW